MLYLSVHILDKIVHGYLLFNRYIIACILSISLDVLIIYIEYLNRVMMYLFVLFHFITFLTELLIQQFEYKLGETIMLTDGGTLHLSNAGCNNGKPVPHSVI